jgi:superfamily I DNA/RNA helicase
MRNVQTSDLTLAQRRILNMPINQNMAIKGIAGSGKTILAIKRIKKILDHNNQARILFLVFNKTLQVFIQNAIIEEGIMNRVDIKTFHKWYKDELNEMAGFNWDAIGLKMQESQAMNNYDYLIIDECQDLGLPIYNAIGKCKNLTFSIFGDNSQRITRKATEIEDIHYTLDIEERVQRLNENYRNGTLLMEVAKEFCTTENADILAGQIVRGQGEKPEIREFNNLEEEIKFIKNICANFGANHSIGIILKEQGNVSVRSLYDQIQDLDGIEVQRMYKGLYDDDRDAYFRLRVGEVGVTILGYNICKGLEFDYVILPFLKCNLFGKSDEEKNNFYVAITRTRFEGKLFLSYNKESGKSDFIDMIPEKSVDLIATESVQTIEEPCQPIDENYKKRIDYDEDIPF